MANLTNEQIEQLQQQLKEKTKEVKDIYNQLTDAGIPLSDDLLDTVSGGVSKKPTVVPRKAPQKVTENVFNR